MSAALDLAIKLSLIDLASRGMKAAADRMMSASDETKRHFDRMIDSAKIAAGAFVVGKAIYGAMKPGIAAAADLQEQMIGVRAELTGGGKAAALLAGEMAQIRATAFDVQAWTPFDMTQIVEMEKGLVKAGARVADIVGKTGAAAATAALAVYEQMDPSSAGSALVGIATPFKIGAEGYMALADAVSRAASASTTGAADIAAAASYAAGPLASMNRTADDMMALIAVMSQVGVQGTSAGTSLKNFFLKAAEEKQFRNANGTLMKTNKLIEVLRKNYGSLPDAVRAEKLKKIFGEEGLPVALALLNKGAGSYEQILQAIADASSLQEKLNARMGAFKSQLNSLGGTSKSTLAILFESALSPASALLGRTNAIVAAAGKAASDNPALGQSLSYAGGAAFAGTALVGGAALIRAGLSGRKLLRGLGGTAVGIAEGKAIQAATGVNPVYVTNAAEIGGGLGSTPAIVGMSASIKHLAAGVLGGTVALAIGYAVGTGINTLITKLLGKSLGETVADPGAAKTAAESAFQTNARAQVARMLRAGKYAEAVRIAEYSGDEALAIRARGARNAALPPVNVSVDVRVDKDGRATAVTRGGNGTTRVNGSRGDLHAR